MSAYRQVRSKRSQSGVALLVVLAFLGLLVGTLAISMLSESAAQQQRVEASSRVLAQAREALFGYAVSRNCAAVPCADRPGNFPFPDYLFPGEAGTGNYDGQADGCLRADTADGQPMTSNPTGIYPNARCVGRLPWNTLGISLPTPTEEDGGGVMPWYAVSANLVDPGCFSKLNPDLLTYPQAGYTCGGAGLAYPWLTLRDKRGNVISNRVAALIILPGPPLAGQARPAPPSIATADQYLDQIVVPAGCTAPCVPGTYRNYDRDDDFIMSDEASQTFNDRVVFITIDELVAALEDRVANEVKVAIDFPGRYAGGVQHLPWMAPFADPTDPASYAPAVGTREGLVPYSVFGQTYRSTLAWSITGATSGPAPPPFVPFNTVTADLPTYKTGYTTTTEGDCDWRTETNTTRAHRVLHCVIEEPVSVGAAVVRRFSVDVSHSSSTTYSVTDATAADVHRRTVNTATTVWSIMVQDFDAGGAKTGEGLFYAQFGTTARFTTRLPPLLPGWYAENDWQRFVFASVAPAYAGGGGAACAAASDCLTLNLPDANATAGLRAVVMLAGPALPNTVYQPATAQARPSASRADYFDTANNVSVGTLVFDRPAPLQAQANDRLVAVTR